MRKYTMQTAIACRCTGFCTAANVCAQALGCWPAGTADCNATWLTVTLGSVELSRTLNWVRAQGPAAAPDFV